MRSGSCTRKCRRIRSSMSGPTASRSCSGPDRCSKARARASTSSASTRRRARLTPVAVKEGVRNSSYLAFDPARKFLYCVNEFKEYEGKASGAVSAFRIDPGDRRPHLPEHQGEPRHRPLPPDRRQDGEKRARRQLRLRQRLRASDRRRRVAEGGVLRDPARGLERRSEAAGRAARARGRALRRQPLRLRAGARRRQGDDLRARCGGRKAHAEPEPALRQSRARRRAAPARHASERQVRVPDQRAELDDDLLCLRRRQGHADGNPDALDASRRLHGAEHLRGGADPSERKVPLRLEPRP